MEGDYLIEHKLLKSQPQKSYYQQVYNVSSNSSNRIPDFRNQLLWEPKITINSEEVVIYFYTSDNSGDYEVCLEGFTINGLPISIREVITIK